MYFEIGSKFPVIDFLSIVATFVQLKGNCLKIIILGKQHALIPLRIEKIFLTKIAHYNEFEINEQLKKVVT